MIRLPWRRGLQPDPRTRLGAAADPLSETAHGSALDSGASSSGSVRGERGAPMVRGARSLQSRMSSVVAAGLMISVGAGMLAWYYARALSGPAATHGPAHTQMGGAPGEGMTLPPFGSASAPAGARAVPAASRAPSVPDSPTAQPAAVDSVAALPATSLLEPPLARAPRELLPQSYGAPAELSPRQQALDRRLAGQVFALVSRAELAAASGDEAAGVAAALPSAKAEEQTPSSVSSRDELQALLRPSELAATQAQTLPTEHLLLPKGAFIDCTLETAIDSTLPGMTTCVTATDTFSADGTVVLLERGTKLIGETRGEMRQGQARVFVVWAEARTPEGVVVRLDSPGTDALGRSGLEGKVNRHFWQRFGAAALVSVIDGAVQSEVQSSSRGGTVVLDPTASEDVLTGILRSTVNIAPTIRVRNGARIQVLVARDIDFRSVYELDAR
jgi:type IV secretion system protein VirB10